MAISQPPFQSTLVDADDRVQTPWAQWFSQLQPVLQAVVASGPTSGRPTQNLFIGYPYFDTTIDQMVYWNGVIWVTYAPSTTGTSILKGNGTGGFNNAIAGTDFAPATSGTAILYGNGTGGFSSVAIGSGVTFAGGVLSATGSGGTVTSVSGTAPIASSGGTTPAISISQAGISTDGYLSSTDWNIFNAKGTVTSVSGTGSVNGITLTGTVTSSGSLTLGGTLGGIGNSQLTNSSITINGSTVSLGGSTTVTATATNALTIGTGLSGTSYNGSTAVTIANSGVLSFSGNSTGLTPATATTGAITLAGILIGANGGTGVANTGKTFTIGGNFTTSGAFTTSLTVTANTALTLPISGSVLSSVTAPAANPITGTPSASNYLRGDGTWATFTTGTVTSVGFTGGLITVATPTTTPAFTVAGTSGGIPYFSSASTWATSAALTANALMIGGGAGVAPATTTTGTGVLTALGTNVGSAGAFVTFNGALGTPSSGTVTNLTGTASININGTVGATTANTGKFTTLEYTGTLTGSTGVLNIGSGQIYKDASGNVGIGTTSPTALRTRNLEISSSGTNDSAAVIVNKRGAGFATLRLGTSGAATGFDVNFNFPNTGDLGFYDLAAAANRMVINSSGIITMGAYGAGAATFSAAGVISSVSDETWKIKDGVPADADSMLKKLEPGYWYYNNEKKEIFGTDRQLGFYAQNVNTAIGPEAAPPPEEGKPWGYYDRSVLAIAVMSLQKALTTIEEQQTVIVQLQADVEALKTKSGL